MLDVAAAAWQAAKPEKRSGPAPQNRAASVIKPNDSDSVPRGAGRVGIQKGVPIVVINRSERKPIDVCADPPTRTRLPTSAITRQPSVAGWDAGETRSEPRGRVAESPEPAAVSYHSSVGKGVRC